MTVNVSNTPIAVQITAQPDSSPIRDTGLEGIFSGRGCSVAEGGCHYPGDVYEPVRRPGQRPIARRQDSIARVLQTLVDLLQKPNQAGEQQNSMIVRLLLSLVDRIEPSIRMPPAPELEALTPISAGPLTFAPEPGTVSEPPPPVADRTDPDVSQTYR